MATEVIRRLIDDLDKGPAADTHDLALDGRRVRIDLSKENLRELEEFLARYFKAGRPVGSNTSISKKGKSSSKTKIDPEQQRVINAWFQGRTREEVVKLANSVGVGANDRGRLPMDVKVAAYNAAHPPRNKGDAESGKLFSESAT